MSGLSPPTLPLVVSEFPKSGGSWVVSMLGDALGLPCRDIYVRPGFELFDIAKHPWYRDAKDLSIPDVCVIKSHEMPDSRVIDFEATEIHLVRDGRDVAVSKFFFERDFCVKNGILASFDQPFEKFIEMSATQWRDYVMAWRARPGVITISYEAFVRDPPLELSRLVQRLVGSGLESSRSDDIAERYSRSNFSASLSPAFKHNTFVRRGVIGDWKNHFSEQDREVFESIAGEALAHFGYEVGVCNE